MPLTERDLFALDRTIDHADQRALIDETYRHGRPFARIYGKPDDEPYWQALPLTDADPTSLPPESQRWFASQPEQALRRWAYFARLDRRLRWTFRDTEASRIVQRLLEPVLPLYEKITKVNIVVQRPGHEVGRHRDLVPGNAYAIESPFHWKEGPSSMTYEGTQWLRDAPRIENESHEARGFVCLKLPLSERVRDVGDPYIVVDGVRYHYDSEDRYFFLCETQVHGALPVDFKRGVVFVNGILDPDALRRVAKLPVAVRRVEPVS